MAELDRLRSTRVGAGRPSARRFELYLETGAEVKKAGLEDVRRTLNHRYHWQRDNFLSSRVQISTLLPLAHKALVPIQSATTLLCPMVPALCGHASSAYVIVNYELQPLNETSVWDFNLVGVVMSHVTPTFTRNSPCIVTQSDQTRKFTIKFVCMKVGGYLTREDACDILDTSRLWMLGGQLSPWVTVIKPKPVFVYASLIHNVKLCIRERSHSRRLIFI